MNVSPAVAGFIKGIGMAILLAICMFLENSANLQGIANPVVASFVVAIASALESHLKAVSGGTSALFGAVKLK